MLPKPVEHTTVVLLVWLTHQSPSLNADCNMSKSWSLRKCLHVRQLNTSTLEETHSLGVLWTAGTQSWNVTWGGQKHSNCFQTRQCYFRSLGLPRGHQHISEGTSRGRPADVSE
uniref:Putative secreted protein n=1 Tax=Ixodes ricinus TaxID=34613 RepID=A0A6B0UKU2_IXORI